jgi:hypothetical protein
MDDDNLRWRIIRTEVLVSDVTVYSFNCSPVWVRIDMHPDEAPMFGIDIERPIHYD